MKGNGLIWLLIGAGILYVLKNSAPAAYVPPVLPGDPNFVGPVDPWGQGIIVDPRGPLMPPRTLPYPTANGTAMPPMMY